VQGTLRGKWLKKSLDLRNWESAQKLVRDWEGGYARGEDATVWAACEAFIKDCEARELSTASLDKRTESQRCLGSAPNRGSASELPHVLHGSIAREEQTNRAQGLGKTA
jgi:hypothetical protein